MRAKSLAESFSKFDNKLNVSVKNNNFEKVFDTLYSINECLNHKIDVQKFQNCKTLDFEQAIDHYYNVLIILVITLAYKQKNDEINNDFFKVTI